MLKKLIIVFVVGFISVSFLTCAGSLKITATPETGDAPLTVQFKPSGLAEGTVSMEYFWYFGTGSLSDSSNEKEPTFTFEEPGTYTVELDLLRNYRSYSDQHTATVKVVVTDPNENPIDSTPSVSVSALPSSGNAPLLVQFSSSVTGGDAPLTYSWTFGDEGTSTEANPSHTYTSAGEYTATLTVTDSDGDSDNDDVVVTVSEETQALSVTIDMTPDAAETCGLEVPVDFGSTVTGGSEPYTYSWDFDNNEDTSTQANPTYCCYFDYRTYNVTLTVTDHASTEATSNTLTFTCVEPD